MKQDSNSNTRLVIETIKDWMKRHAGQIPPGQNDMLKDISLPEDFKFNYTMCKKQAFAELEKAGYILKKFSATCQQVDGFKCPENIGKKVMDKLIPDDSNEIDAIEIVQKAFKAKPEDKPSTPVPTSPSSKSEEQVHVFINKMMSPEEAKGVGRMIYNLGKLPSSALLSVKVKITG